MTKVLFVVSECAPFVKTGGLADVAGALPIALAQIGTDVRVLLPGYSSVIKQIKPSETVARYEDLFGGPANLLTCKIAGLDMLILDAPHLYNREGGI
jgi:starch synthase